MLFYFHIFTSLFNTSKDFCIFNIGLCAGWNRFWVGYSWRPLAIPKIFSRGILKGARSLGDNRGISTGAKKTLLERFVYEMYWITTNTTHPNIKNTIFLKYVCNFFTSWISTENTEFPENVGKWKNIRREIFYFLKICKDL